VNAAIESLVPITRELSSDPLAPADFSRSAVAAGLPPFTNGFITYDNLLYPGSAPQTGAPLDTYGDTS
jgi:hypothetical protein